jgi:hypothetical protein
MLNTRMNADIDNIIAKLEAVKKIHGNYTKKADAVAQVAIECQDFGHYWNEKLYEWLMDARG